MSTTTDEHAGFQYLGGGVYRVLGVVVSPSTGLYVTGCPVDFPAPVAASAHAANGGAR